MHGLVAIAMPNAKPSVLPAHMQLLSVLPAMVHAWDSREPVHILLAVQLLSVFTRMAIWCM